MSEELQISHPSSVDSPLLNGCPDGHTYYFAIGSMCNPVSLALRGIKSVHSLTRVLLTYFSRPIGSWPAVLHDWQIEFRGGGGMANVREEPGASFHGVLHLLTNDDMLALDRIEGSYVRLPVIAKLYDGKEIACTVYKMDETRFVMQVNNPPGERYLDIISRGLKHYGASEEYITWIQSHPCTPRKQMHECRVIPIDRPLQPINECSDDHLLTPSEPLAWRGLIRLDQLEKCTGTDGRPLMTAVTGKVLEWIGPLNSPQMQYALNNHAGKDISLSIARNLYEPRFPVQFYPNSTTVSHFDRRFQQREKPCQSSSLH